MGVFFCIIPYHSRKENIQQPPLSLESNRFVTIFLLISHTSTDSFFPPPKEYTSNFGSHKNTMTHCFLLLVMKEEGRSHGTNKHHTKLTSLSIKLVTTPHIRPYRRNYAILLPLGRNKLSKE